ncbi:MAG: CPBP family intramembrane metalloprotease [Saprospiraceae bacterium]|nr:CPBP family intramembrane metalloprotease [Saprospiraceae bacterium]
MKNKERIICGLLITAIIFSTATIISSKTNLGIDFIPKFFVTLTIELLLSMIAIFTMRKYLSYNISLPKLKSILKPVIIALAVTIIINVLMTIITKIAGEVIEVPAALSKLKPIQVFLFVFLYASIAEELLFRGFLMNLLKPLETINFIILRRKMSLPVIISAIAFSAVHLILLTTGVNSLFLIRIVIFTFCLGLVAGYYQEKHNNHLFAIIVHMTGNSLAVIASLSLN